jgi:hypothetical protein
MPTPRVPLGAIDDNIIRRQPVTPFTRGYIDKGAASGQSAASLGRELGKDESTIRKTLKLNPLRIDGNTQPRSGRPPIACPRAIRRLLRLVRHEPTLTYAQVKTRLIITWSHDTIMRILDKYGIKKWRKKRRPVLTSEVVVKRLEWALEHVDWTLEQWCKIIFSDECSVERGAGGQRE